MTTLAVLTSGGDSPGMNAAVRGAVKVAAARGVRVLGVRDGYDGLIDGAFLELTTPSMTAPCGLAASPDVDAHGNAGGTFLGSARCARFREASHRKTAVEHLRTIDGLIVVGGNGSLTGAHLLAQECSTPVIGLPASIDNDIGCTATAIGVDTALNTIVDACDRIADTARSHRRAFVIEVMGRQSGYLAMASAVAAGADAVLLREHERSDEQFVAFVADTIHRAFAGDSGRRRVLIVKAEGVDIPCTLLVRRVQESLDHTLPGVEVRATVLGHLVRGGRPTYQDRMVAGRLARSAVETLLRGESDAMTAWQAPFGGGAPTDDPAVTLFSLKDVLIETDALLQGTSVVTRWRVQMLTALEGALGL